MLHRVRALGCVAIREEPFEYGVCPVFADVAEVNRLVDATRLEECTINVVKRARLSSVVVLDS